MGAIGVWLLPSLLACVFVGGCGSPGTRWSPSWRVAYGRFEDGERTTFAEARRLMDSGERMGALGLLRELCAGGPDNLEAGAWLQDLEAELLRDGVDVLAGTGKGGHSLKVHTAADVLRLAYAERADVEPTVASFVLAARAETDVIAALNLLGKAIELDPTCAWAHYGRSHVLLQDRTRSDRWGLAREALDKALQFDFGHLRARRLEAWMAAEEGSRATAEAQIARWIDAAEGDPRVAQGELSDARQDLALLLLLKGEDSRARRMLEDLEGDPTHRQRRLMLLTVALQEGGNELAALDAAMSAQGAERAATALPLVQEALLLELFLGRPEEAQERWKDVAELSEDTTNMAELIQGLRARVRLEWADRARESRAGD